MNTKNNILNTSKSHVDFDCKQFDKYIKKQCIFPNINQKLASKSKPDLFTKEFSPNNFITNITKVKTNLNLKVYDDEIDKIRKDIIMSK